MIPCKNMNNVTICIKTVSFCTHSSFNVDLKPNNFSSDLTLIDKFIYFPSRLFSFEVF